MAVQITVHTVFRDCNSVPPFILRLAPSAIPFVSNRWSVVNSFPSPEKFLFFCTEKIVFIEWPSLAPRLRITISIENFVICCDQVTEVFCPRYCIASASSARSPCNLGSLADFTICVFREVS